MLHSKRSEKYFDGGKEQIYPENRSAAPQETKQQG
jgi:hypothetical protein